MTLSDQFMLMHWGWKLTFFAGAFFAGAADSSAGVALMIWALVFGNIK